MDRHLPEPVSMFHPKWKVEIKYMKPLHFQSKLISEDKWEQILADDDDKKVVKLNGLESKFQN